MLRFLALTAAIMDRAQAHNISRQSLGKLLAVALNCKPKTYDYADDAERKVFNTMLLQKCC